jgi:hypothetical protein
VIVRLVNNTRVVPAIVSGVVSPSAQRSILTRLRSSRRDRNRLAALLQILISSYRSVNVKVSFGHPVDLRDSIEDATMISDAIAENTRLLLSRSVSEG